MGQPGPIRASGLRRHLTGALASHESAPVRYTLPLATIDVPDEWRDASTYHFVSPPLAMESADLRSKLAGRRTNVGTSHASLVLSRLTLSASLEETLAAEELELRRGFGGFEVTSRAPWNHPVYGPLAAFEARFLHASGVRLRQVRVFFVDLEDHPDVCLTISAEDARFEEEVEKLRPVFEAILLATER